MDIVLATLLVVICSRAREYNNLSEASPHLTYSRVCRAVDAEGVRWRRPQGCYCNCMGIYISIVLLYYSTSLCSDRSALETDNSHPFLVTSM